MKKNFSVFAVIASSAFFMGACTSNSQESKPEQSAPVGQEISATNQVAQQDTIKKSIPSQAEGTIGQTNVKISYHSPGVKGRVVWGGLVPYDQVWVTGAHKATAVEFSKAVIIDGTEVPAGKYALFTIPGRAEWTIILNKDYEQHLADEYDQKKDILRVKVKPETLGQHQERLKYEVVGSAETEGAISISWEKVQVSLPVGTNS
ncbi:DUF2911 domain-containing protein [Rufibacter immobilis]|uniref:DUF2911 domain-containing protein n=1 Tax=Rufibacter immobilis TaxID=1348778 RepID=UPI0035EED67E